MSQSINKIHSKSLIQPSNDEDLYIFNENNRWEKVNNKLYKVYDKHIEDLNISDYNAGDIIVLHDRFTNCIKCSEQIDTERNGGLYPTDEQKYYWFLNNLKIDENYSTNMPNISKEVFLLDANNKNLGEITDHCISQSFINKPCYKNIFSCYIKKSPYTKYFAISIESDNFGIGVYAKFNLDNMTTPSIELLDKNYSDTTHMSSFISDTESNFEEIIFDDEIYYRVYIVAKFNFNSQCRCKLNILNDEGKFKFTVASATKKFGFYASGFQLEHSKDTTKPNVYIPTLYTKNTIKPLTAIYQVYENKFIKKELSKICYFDSVKEFYDANSDKVTLEDYAPSYYNLKVGDIGLVSSIISFANPDIEKNKNIVNRRNSNNNNMDDISAKKIREICGDTILKLGSLNGTSEYEKFPIFSIFYDKKSKEYKFISDNGIYTLSYSSIKKTYKGITNALINNQGYFETWCEKGKGIYKHGFNTGGNYNFWKLNKIR